MYNEEQRAFLVFANESKSVLKEDFENSVTLDELNKLVQNIDLQVVGYEAFNLTRPNPKTFLGSGQVVRLLQKIQEEFIDVVVFNEQLTPRLQRNLEEALKVCVIDRQEVIIQIFADRAKTAEAKVQTELAVLQYSLPRLTRKWTALSQQRGGAFRSRGSGETKLELNKRYVKKRIFTLNKKLLRIKDLRNTQRKSRQKSTLKTGSIIGYTNSGKSSLLKTLSKQNIGVQDKLFATLDAQTKRVFLLDGSFVLLSDTVGFIDNLPHELIDAFRSTLEEVQYSDFHIIVCDASHRAMLDCLDITLEVLESLNSDQKQKIIFVNKVDKIYDNSSLLKLQNRFPNAILGSVKEKRGIKELLERIQSLN